MADLHVNSTPFLRRIALVIEHGIYSLRRFVVKTLRLKSPSIAPEIYTCISFPGHVAVKGRVLAIRKLSEPNENDSWWVNGRQMIKRWITSECPDTQVMIRLGKTITETVTDEEGYFDVEIENPSGETSLEVSLPTDPEKRNFPVPVLQNDAAPSVVIISDIDDTIFVSNTARLLGMIKTALTGNALTRQVFPGIAELYDELRKGPDGSSKNPISYVTSSPWNLHSLISLIFQHRSIPDGAYFMTDWGLSEADWLKESNPIHKRRAILRIMRWFPNSPVVLLGDSSQHDAEIYTRIATEQPERIAAIAIRNVTGLSEPQIDVPKSVPFLLHEDTPAARDFVLQRLGWKG